jgi:hypothetical protein
MYSMRSTLTQRSDSRWATHNQLCSEVDYRPDSLSHKDTAVYKVHTLGFSKSMLSLMPVP